MGEQMPGNALAGARRLSYRRGIALFEDIRRSRRISNATALEAMDPVDDLGLHVLTARETQDVLAALAHPPEPNERLRRAFERRRALIAP